MTQPVLAITGGNSGIGLAISKLFLEKGYRVAVLARSEHGLKELKETNADNTLIVRGDVTNTKNIEQFYQDIKTQWGGIDTVIANAGIALPQNILDVTEQSIDSSINVNFKGVFFTAQKALKYINNESSIILISSIQAQKGSGEWSVYGATKAAVRSLARSLAQELGPRGIRVNALSPGVTDTPILNKFGYTPQDLSEILQQVSENTPLGRIGMAEETANAALFLASTQASFVTGADLPVDGGLAQI